MLFTFALPMINLRITPDAYEDLEKKALEMKAEALETGLKKVIRMAERILKNSQYRVCIPNAPNDGTCTSPLDITPFNTGPKEKK